MIVKNLITNSSEKLEIDDELISLVVIDHQIVLPNGSTLDISEAICSRV